jgi:hypothetical protein
MRSRFQQLLLSKAVGFLVKSSGDDGFLRMSPEQSSFQRDGATTPAQQASRQLTARTNFSSRGLEDTLEGGGLISLTANEKCPRPLRPSPTRSLTGAAFNPPRLDPTRPPTLRPRPRCIVQRQRESPLQITRAGGFRIADSGRAAAH